MVEHLLHVLAERAVLAVEEPPGSLGQRRSGSDAVDQDPVGPQLQGHGAGQVHHARLGRHEGTLKPQRDQAGDRGDVDDPARCLVPASPVAAALLTS